MIANTLARAYTISYYWATTDGQLSMTMKSVILLAIAVLATCSAAQAGPSEAMAFAIGQCSSQPDEKARLACYDQISAQLKSGALVSAPAPQAYQQPGATQPFVQVPTPGSSALAVAPAPVPAPMAQAPAPMARAPAAQNNSGSWYDPTSWFGKDKPQKTSTSPADFGAEALPQQRTAAAGEPAEPARLDEIRANVRAVAYNTNGRFTVTLANGQVWKQLDGDTGKARFKEKGGDVVTISRGVLASYNLVVEGRAALFKVKRIQ